MFQGRQLPFGAPNQFKVSKGMVVRQDEDGSLIAAVRQADACLEPSCVLYIAHGGQR